MRNGKCLAMEAGILAIVAPLTVSGLYPLWLRAQSATPAIASEAFEVASVKPNKSGDGRIFFQMQPGGRFTATNVPVRELIRMAYGIQNFQLVGGPDWIGSERFDIVAKAESDPPPSPPGGPPGPMLMMVRALLVERFKLAVHNETKDLPIYALVMARADGRLGPQLRASQVDCAALMAAARGRGGPPPAPPRPGERPPCGMFGGFGRIAAGGVSMAQLAMNMSQRVNRVVLDRTGLTGLYEFELEFTPDQMPQGPPPPGAPPLPPIDPNGPSIFTALQEQLGLKLDAQRGPVEVLVIDGVEQPTPD
jgi:bla regulator protein BlaR1